MAQIRLTLTLEMPDIQASDLPDAVRMLEADGVIEYMNNSGAGFQAMMSVEHQVAVSYLVELETVESKAYPH